VGEQQRLHSRDRNDCGLEQQNRSGLQNLQSTGMSSLCSQICVRANEAVVVLQWLTVAEALSRLLQVLGDPNIDVFANGEELRV